MAKLSKKINELPIVGEDKVSYGQAESNGEFVRTKFATKAVKSINGIEPDENGNVVMETGGASSWNDLQDRPFESIPVFTPFEWNGEMEGGEMLTYSGVPMGIKISDDVIPQEELVGTWMRVKTDGKWHTSEIERADFVTEEGYGYNAGLMCVNGTSFTISANGRDIKLSAPSPGMYMCFMLVQDYGMEAVAFDGARCKQLERCYIESPVFVVTFTPVGGTWEDATEYAVNRTNAEISAAARAGKLVVAYDASAGNFAPLTATTTDVYASFCCTWVTHRDGKPAILFSEYYLDELSGAPRAHRTDRVFQVVTE